MGAHEVKKLLKTLKPLSIQEDADASVALLLKPVRNYFEVLLVKRSEYIGDPWSGKMAFPGGKRNEDDQDLKQTIVRETLEETNIDLRDRCRFLGVMDPVRPNLRPEMKVLPFVVLLEHDPFIKLNEELERFVWISPKELAKNRGMVKLDFGKTPAFLLGDNVIWGMTYTLLERLIDILGYPN